MELVVSKLIVFWIYSCQKCVFLKRTIVNTDSFETDSVGNDGSKLVVLKTELLNDSDGTDSFEAASFKLVVQNLIMATS